MPIWGSYDLKLSLNKRDENFSPCRVRIFHPSRIKAFDRTFDKKFFPTSKPFFLSSFI